MLNDEREEKDRHITAGILVIGDEILSGRTKDLNIGYMADHFTAIGIDLREVRIVPDVTEEIIGAVNAMRVRYNYLFTTGGIGPTHDDITADAIAKAFNLPIDYDVRAIEILENHYQKGELTDARRRMARIPKGADLIENSVSAAPGIWLENVIVMAGVPRIMQAMLDWVTPKLKTGRIMHSATLQLHEPESAVANLLGEHQQAYRDVSMGSYPYYRHGKLGTHLVLRSVDLDRLGQAETGLQKRLHDNGFDAVLKVEESD